LFKNSSTGYMCPLLYSVLIRPCTQTFLHTFRVDNVSNIS
jgi:hypothetical protein